MPVCQPNQTFLVGDRPTIQMTFRAKSVGVGDLTDPASIIVIVSGAGLSGTFTYPSDPSITHESLGVWLFELPGPFTAQGDCWLTVTAAGGNSDVVEQTVLRVRSLVNV